MIKSIDIEEEIIYTSESVCVEFLEKSNESEVKDVCSASVLNVFLDIRPTSYHVRGKERMTENTTIYRQ